MAYRVDGSTTAGPAYALLAGSRSYGKRVTVSADLDAAGAVMLVCSAFRPDYVWLAGLDVDGYTTGSPKRLFIARFYGGSLKVLAADSYAGDARSVELELEVEQAGTPIELRLSVDGAAPLVYADSVSRILDGRVGVGIRSGSASINSFEVSDL